MPVSLEMAAQNEDVLIIWDGSAEYSRRLKRQHKMFVSPVLVAQDARITREGSTKHLYHLRRQDKILLSIELRTQNVRNT